MRSDSELSGVSPSEQSFDVVFVCTGNRARSPFAAALLAKLTYGLPVAVESFGVLDLGQSAALPGAIWAAETFGVDLTRHTARPMSPGSLEGADLVIGFEQFHVATAVVEAGAARERAFLMTELADILGAMGSESLGATSEALIDRAHSLRIEGAWQRREIADPLGMSRQQVLSVFDAIRAHVSVIAGELFGDRGQGVRP